MSTLRTYPQRCWLRSLRFNDLGGKALLNHGSVTRHVMLFYVRGFAFLSG